MSKQRVRTLLPSAVPVARVQDPAAREVFLALRRALKMGLETDRARQLIIRAIDERCGDRGEDAPPDAPP
jgi:hypothetical protein